MDDERSIKSEDVKTEVLENEENAVVLQNITTMEVDDGGDIPIVFNEFATEDSDGNLRINAYDESHNVIHTYIIQNAGEYSGDPATVGTQVIEALQQQGIDGQEYGVIIEEEDTEEVAAVDEPQYHIEEDFDENTAEYRYQQVDEDTEEEEDDKKQMMHCDVCDKGFKTAAGLKRHITVNHTDEQNEEDPLTLQLCPCCGEPSDTAHTFGEFKCDHCDKLFAQENFLERHMSIEHPTGDGYTCAECKKPFKVKEDLIDHMKIHPVKSVKCLGCNREFTRKYHLDRHIIHTGCMGPPKKTFDCRVCHRFFTRKDNLAEHLRAHAGQGKKKKRFICEFCKKEFQGAGLLNIHVRTHTGEKPFPCDMCQKRFPSSGAMKKHRRMHTGEKPYTCMQCGKQFAAKETLNRHVRTHTGERPHRCQFCGKTFIQATQLRAHIFHHTGENAFKCPHCDRAFNRRVRLTTHIKFMHEGADPLRCPECDKTFFRKEDVARHMLSHSGLKPFKCNECDKSFSVKSSLKTHSLTHRKEPPCSCDVCGRAFIRQDCLMRHIRARHRDVLEDILAHAEKEKLQQQLLSAATDAATRNGLTENIVWNELTLTESIKELLTLLVDEDCLNDFGYPDTPVDRVLDSVIKRCGCKPASEEDFDYIGRMRENAKLLFTVVIDDEAVKELFNNQTVDEVILHVLRLARKQNTGDKEKDDEDEEDNEKEEEEGEEEVVDAVDVEGEEEEEMIGEMEQQVEEEEVIEEIADDVQEMEDEEH